jgi:cytochrome P450 family 6
MADVIGEAADAKIGINYRDLAARFMCDIIGQVAFGLECNALRDSECQLMVLKDFLSFKDWNQRMRYVFACGYPDLCRKLNFQVTPKHIQSFFLKLVVDTVDYREKNNIKRNDFLSSLIQLKNHGKLDGDENVIGKISFTDLAAQCFVFFIAVCFEIYFQCKHNLTLNLEIL